MLTLLRLYNQDALLTNTMTTVFEKVSDKYRRDGLASLIKSTINKVFMKTVVPPIKYIYTNSLREFLPYTSYIKRNGVRIERSKPLDNIFSGALSPAPSPVPNYKQGNVGLIKSVAEKGDKVVTIGGGYGVTAVHAATQVGEGGEVVVYEASKKQVDIIRKAISNHGLLDRTSVHHSLVGDDIEVYDGLGEPSTTHPSNLPPCNILEMDCEGAEIGILSQLSHKPDTIIVELHPHKHPEAPEKSIQLLTELGYSITEYRDQTGMKLSEEQFNELLCHDRHPSKFTIWGGKHPPVIKAIRRPN